MSVRHSPNVDKTQRLILRNQFLILAKLDPDNAEGYEEHATVLGHGYAFLYDDIFTEIYDETSVADGTFVADVLDMYTLFDSSPAYKSKAVQAEYLHKFLGFDGNHESKLLSLTEHFFKTDKWPSIKLHQGRDGFNSHSPMRENYTLMLAKLKQIGVRELTEKHILDIIAAGKIGDRQEGARS